MRPNASAAGEPKSMQSLSGRVILIDCPQDLDIVKTTAILAIGGQRICPHSMKADPYMFLGSQPLGLTSVRLQVDWLAIGSSIRAE